MFDDQGSKNANPVSGKLSRSLGAKVPILHSHCRVVKPIITTTRGIFPDKLTCSRLVDNSDSHASNQEYAKNLEVPRLKSGGYGVRLTSCKY
jgi:hypothetical protein